MTRKKILLLSLSIFFALLIALVVFYVSGTPFRKALPGPIAETTYPKPISEQLMQLYKKAYYITTANNIGRLGMAYQANAEYEKAVECYQLAIRKNYHHWLWHYYLGKIYLEQGEPRKAIESFNAVNMLEPGNMIAHYYLGEAHQKTGTVKEAKNMFVIVINYSGNLETNHVIRETIFPIQTYAKFQLARLYTQNNQSDSAALLLQQIIQDHINFGPAYRLLGSVYQQKDSLALSSKFTVRANDLADYSPPADKYLDDIALLSRSDEYLLKQIDDAIRSDNFIWALTLCEHAMKYLPDNQQIISRYIRENIRQGKKEVATKYLDQHLKLYKNDRKELLEYIDLLFDNGLPEEALQYVNQLRQLMPENPVLPVWLYRRGKRKEAMTIMAGLIKQYPEDEKILAAVIPLIIETGDIALAEQYLATLHKKVPGTAEYFKLYGLISENNGDMNAALSMYEKAFNAGENSLSFCRELTGTFIRVKNWQKADEYFKLSLKLYPNDAELLEAYGKFLLACPDTQYRNIPVALEFSERAFINVNGSYNTRLSAGKNLATAYISQGNKKKAAFFINETVALAKKGNRQEEYVKYFRELTSAK